MSSRRTKILIFLLYLAFLLLLAELALRLQQKLGPFYRLEFNEISLSCLSDTLNHKNPPGATDDPFIFWNTLGDRRRSYDQDGIRIETLRPYFKRSRETLTILFMGDSFMEGFDDKHTIPQYIWEYFQKTSLAGYPINLLNAGCSSYAPIIFIVEARQLIPKLKPDIVVVDIDETDIIDHNFRYQGLIVRDAHDVVTAVKPSPLLFEFLNGFLEIKKQPSYLARFILKFHHTRIRMPRLTRLYPQGLTLDKALRSYLYGLGGTSEINYMNYYPGFKKDVVELIQTLTRLMGDKNRVLLLYHSNTRRIQNKTKIDSPVLAAIKSASKETGTAYYDATEDLTKSFTGDLDNYYVATDDLKHFNFEGLRIYSEFVARKLEPFIRRVIRLKN